MSDLEKHQAEQQMKLFDSLSPSLKVYAREYGLKKALELQLVETMPIHQDHDTEWNRLMLSGQ